MENGAPEAKVAKGTELTKTAFEKAISNMKELSEMVAKSNGEAFDVINRRVAESLDEIRDLTQQYQKSRRSRGGCAEGRPGHNRAALFRLRLLAPLLCLLLRGPPPTRSGAGGR